MAAPRPQCRCKARREWLQRVESEWLSLNGGSSLHDAQAWLQVATVSGRRRRVMQHLDLRTDEDRQQVLCSLQWTGVGRPGLREDPLGVGAVRVDGQTRRDAP